MISDMPITPWHVSGYTIGAIDRKKNLETLNWLCKNCAAIQCMYPCSDYAILSIEVKRFTVLILMCILCMLEQQRRATRSQANKADWTAEGTMVLYRFADCTLHALCCGCPCSMNHLSNVHQQAQLRLIVAAFSSFVWLQTIKHKVLLAGTDRYWKILLEQES